jgi:hypothetical protein
LANDNRLPGRQRTRNRSRAQRERQPSAEIPRASADLDVAQGDLVELPAAESGHQVGLEDRPLAGYSPDFGNQASNDLDAQDGGRDGLDFHGSVGLGAYSAVVLSQ